jgi:hypothetical protein
MKLGESIQTYNPTQALKREYGTFEVRTPGGEEITITCKPGDSMANIQWTESENRKPFFVTKISEPVNLSDHVTPLRQVG